MDGIVLGTIDGTIVLDGNALGNREGMTDGLSLGPSDGLMLLEGTIEGCVEGLDELDGVDDGMDVVGADELDGRVVGSLDAVGVPVGTVEGLNEGLRENEGLRLGSAVKEGRAVVLGWLVKEGTDEGTADVDGSALGTADTGPIVVCGRTPPPSPSFCRPGTLGDCVVGGSNARQGTGGEIIGPCENGEVLGALLNGLTDGI